MDTTVFSRATPPRAAYRGVELGLIMARGLRIAWVASVLACGTLFGHVAAYALVGRSLADGHHGYFGSLLEVAVTAALFGSALFVGHTMAAHGLRRVETFPALPSLWLIAASVQVAGFAAIELLEGNVPDALGCAAEIVVALFTALAIALFVRVVQQCAQAISSSYARRVPSAPAVRPVLVPVDALASLTVRAGVRRFKRPPPIIG